MKTLRFFRTPLATHPLMQHHIPKDVNLENNRVRTSSLSVSSSLSKTAGVQTALQSSLFYYALLLSDILYKV
jgi:hypothetical protein